MPMRNLLTLFMAAMLSMVCYQRASRNRFVGTLADAMNIIDEHYVDPVDSRQLFEGAMDGMLAKLDPYSSYTNPREYARFQESLEQNFGGIGILVEVNPETKRITVMNPLPGTPAHKAGILPGDIILKIGGQDTVDMPLDKSVTYMRGPEGSEIKLTLQHADQSEPYELTLKREKISVESVRGDRRSAEGVWDFHLAEDPRIGLIRVATFGEQTIEEFTKALETFERPGQEVDGLIIDLRTNPGGLLSAAKEMCDLFLDGGVIVSTRGRGGVTTSVYEAEPGVAMRDLPMVILVDRYTASASEIVSACLQDYDKAVVCGERTWGKGTVQNVAPLEGGRSAMRLTTATYWRPSGKNIHKRKDAKEEDDWGVRPDDGLEVILTDEEREQLARLRSDRDYESLRGVKMENDKPAAPQSPDAPPTPEVEENPSTPPGNEKKPLDDPQLRKAIKHLQKLRAPVTSPQAG